MMKKSALCCSDIFITITVFPLPFTVRALAHSEQSALFRTGDVATVKQYPLSIQINNASAFELSKRELTEESTTPSG